MSRLYRRVDGSGVAVVSGPEIEWEHDNPEWRPMTRRERIEYELWRPRVSLGVAVLIVAAIYAIRIIIEVLT